MQPTIQIIFTYKERVTDASVGRITEYLQEKFVHSLLLLLHTWARVIWLVYVYHVYDTIGLRHQEDSCSDRYEKNIVID